MAPCLPSRPPLASDTTSAIQTPALSRALTERGTGAEGGGQPAQVLDSMVYSLGITKHDVRHTVSTLRDYGNISSGAFLLAFERLQREGTVKVRQRCRRESGDGQVGVVTEPLQIALAHGPFARLRGRTLRSRLPTRHARIVGLELKRRCAWA